MKKFNRIFTVVLDSLGVGEAPDAKDFGDVGSDTLGHICEKMPSMNIPNLQQLGIANLKALDKVAPVSNPSGYYCKFSEKSNGKDTMTGHWEIMGLYIDTPFQTFTETGFPKDLIDELEKQCGHKIIGNKAASGTEIIKELGEEHLKTKAMIVYTSADSVLQIAAHEEVFGLDELYRCCEIAREITLQDKWKVGRVIARPFIGNNANDFQRTSNRHDYALKPFGKTVLNALVDQNITSIGVGKINDIFDGEGISKTYKSKSSVHGMQQTIEIAKEDFKGHVFTNLVDFDALWGHRRNPIGYGEEIERFDVLLKELMENLKEDDLLILTADHGNDPTFTGSDHTREYIPVIFYSSAFKGHGLLPTDTTFASIGATIADNFEVEMPKYGRSYLGYLK